MNKQKNYLEIYCDGGVYSNKNKIVWGYIIVDNDKDIYSEQGYMNASGGFDVERAESEAIYRACKYVQKNLSNYRLYTDSRSVIDKIENKVNNATGNPHIKGIQNIIKEIKSYILPVSLTLEWKRRRSNRWSEKIDDLLEEIGEK